MNFIAIGICWYKKLTKFTPCNLFLNKKQNYTMSKKWEEHTSEEKKAVYEALAVVYEEAGHPKQLEPPS